MPLDVEPGAARRSRALARALRPRRRARPPRASCGWSTPAMERAIRVISVERGHDPRDFTLVAFGGAGGHARLRARRGARHARVLVPRIPACCRPGARWRADCGARLAQTVRLVDPPPRALGARLRAARGAGARARCAPTAAATRRDRSAYARRALPRPVVRAPRAARAPATAPPSTPRTAPATATPTERARSRSSTCACGRRGGARTPPLPRGGRRAAPRRAARRRRTVCAATAAGSRADALRARRARRGGRARGPALITELSATTVVPPAGRCASLPPATCSSSLERGRGSMRSDRRARPDRARGLPTTASPPSPRRWASRSAARAFSPNIKERRDYSCARVRRARASWSRRRRTSRCISARRRSRCAPRSRACRWSRATSSSSTTRIAGGTHLPDVTVGRAGVRRRGAAAVGYVANRAHHADIGGMSPGSMPLALRDLPGGPAPAAGAPGAPAARIDGDVLALFLANTRVARRAARRPARAARGAARRRRAAARAGRARRRRRACSGRMHALQDYTERLMRAALAALPRGVYAPPTCSTTTASARSASAIAVRVRLGGGRARRRLHRHRAAGARRRQRQLRGHAARPSSTSSARWRATPIPPNAGMRGRSRSARRRAPSSTPTSPPPSPAATSRPRSASSTSCCAPSRAPLPDRIPAASCGSMNNLAFGGAIAPAPARTQFSYYETLAGGAGAGPRGAGRLGRPHAHDQHAQHADRGARSPAPGARDPLRRAPGSGGRGRHRGGDGIVREIEFLAPAQVTLLTERRAMRPYGLAGGEGGRPGANELVRRGRRQRLPAKATIAVEPGDRIRVETPGGGGLRPPPASTLTRQAAASAAASASSRSRRACAPSSADAQRERRSLRATARARGRLGHVERAYGSRARSAAMQRPAPAPSVATSWSRRDTQLARERLGARLARTSSTRSASRRTVASARLRASTIAAGSSGRGARSASRRASSRTRSIRRSPSCLKTLHGCAHVFHERVVPSSSSLPWHVLLLSLRCYAPRHNADRAARQPRRSGAPSAEETLTGCGRFE